MIHPIDSPTSQYIVLTPSTGLYSIQMTLHITTQNKYAHCVCLSIILPMGKGMGDLSIVPVAVQLKRGDPKR